MATIGLGTIGLARRRQARPLPGGAATTRRLAIAVAAVAVGSFALSLILTTAAEPWAFFTLPARAWELALGGLLALGAARLARLPASLGGGLIAIGLAFVGLSGVLLQQSTPFPGTAALLPTVVSERWAMGSI